MAFSDPIVIGSQNFVRTKDTGIYISTSSTLDQPNGLMLASDLTANRPSFVVKRKLAFNDVMQPNVLPDRGLEVYVVARSLSKDLALFTGASIQPLVGELNSFLSIANINRLLLGEL